eukprot:CAMPEP_0201176262 /NCGR_PEP_ID=MMETSP0851-20130426/104476_1 /ASSEMBLY_ACC=CAM_ASM_000631 /TAXON_ID=183588 /ORGANISM="Pseudo-nitzschia fraudulenta, Strain WWA7" /LENGTH=151 /DNA_ID=CAMNT_0047459623 /DNA_START=102 /DNA_END=554 /DNA_ORIENTATION=-
MCRRWREESSFRFKKEWHVPAAEGARRRRGVVENGCRGLAWVGGCSRTGGGGCTVHRPRVAFPAARAQRRDFVRFRRGEPWNPTAGAVRSGPPRRGRSVPARASPAPHHSPLVGLAPGASDHSEDERTGGGGSVGRTSVHVLVVCRKPTTD